MYSPRVKQVQLGQCAQWHAHMSKGIWQISTSHAPQIYCQIFYRVTGCLKLVFVCVSTALPTRLSICSLYSAWSKPGSGRCKGAAPMSTNSQNSCFALRILGTLTFLAAACLFLISNINASAFLTAWQMHPAPVLFADVLYIYIHIWSKRQKNPQMWSCIHYRRVLGGKKVLIWIFLYLIMSHMVMWWSVHHTTEQKERLTEKKVPSSNPG